MVALGLLGGMSLALIAGFVWWLWLFSPLVFLGILAAAAASRHRTDGEQIAAAIVDCGLLDGRPPAEVRRLLGRPQEAGRERWAWEVGTVNDSLGPGDGQDFTVHFDRDGRVTRSALSDPPD